MNIVFNINKLGLEGIGATISSLCRNCSDTKKLKLWFFCSQLYQSDKENIISLLSTVDFKGKTEFVNFNAQGLFGHLNSLHGDWTTYGRLLIPKYVDSDSALYLDSDLVITTDVLKLKGIDLKETLLGAVFGCETKFALENKFLITKLNFLLETSYFNAGVLIFNIKRWNELNMDSVCFAFGNQYPTDLACQDQTILNGLCKGVFTRLPSNFNVQWKSTDLSEPSKMYDSIIHFVGSPKPWDLFGKTIHGGHPLWEKYNSPNWNDLYCTLSLGKLKRTWNIKKSILKSFATKFKQVNLKSKKVVV